MANVKDVDPQLLIKRVAELLKEKISKPEYVDFVKSGAGRERPPSDKDFWYVRSASLLRTIYLNGPIGVSRLRTRYGNRKRHVAYIHHHHYKAGGSIIRDALNELEKAGFVTKVKGGRVVTPAGKSFLDHIANELAKGA